MKYIDKDRWKRKEHFDFFHAMDYPQFNICMNLDVSNFKEFTSKNNLSFYHAMVFAVTTVINQHENFKYRIRGNEIVLHDLIHPSFTDMNNDEMDELFKMVTVNLEQNIHEFEKIAKETSQNQLHYIRPEHVAERDDLIFITCIPWISFTQITHPISINKEDSVPKLSWGKYFKQEGKLMLPFSIQANHAFVDGTHVGKYLFELQQFIDDFK